MFKVNNKDIRTATIETLQSWTKGWRLQSWTKGWRQIHKIKLTRLFYEMFYS